MRETSDPRGYGPELHHEEEGRGGGEDSVLDVKICSAIEKELGQF